MDNSVESDDRLYRIQPIMDHLNNVMKKNYVPDKSLSIDESMMLWRGRLIFRQYIKNKKHKYGIVNRMDWLLKLKHTVEKKKVHKVRWVKHQM